MSLMGTTQFEPGKTKLQIIKKIVSIYNSIKQNPSYLLMNSINATGRLYNVKWYVDNDALVSAWKKVVKA
jgi:hypothetical protein